MQSTKIIISLWVRWKKPMQSAITLDSEDEEGAQDIGDNTCDKYIKIDILISSLIRKLFKGSNIEQLIQRMFVHIRTQLKNL